MSGVEVLFTMASNQGEEVVTNADIKQSLASEAKTIWQTLSKLNVNDHTEKKANLTYLSWSWAYQTMMDHFPEMVINWHTFVDTDGQLRDVLYYPDRTASVMCTVSIGDVHRQMWLPVMDNRNNAIQNPNSRDISDTKMRCLVKCFAMFGLGMYIFAGEDLPPEDKFDLPSKIKTAEDLGEFLKAVENHAKKLKTKGDLKGFFKTLEPVFSDLRELTDANGSTGYEVLVAWFTEFSTKLK